MKMTSDNIASQNKWLTKIALSVSLHSILVGLNKALVSALVHHLVTYYCYFSSFFLVTVNVFVIIKFFRLITSKQLILNWYIIQ